MHKSSYPRLPGLPRRHALNASGTGPAAARRLYRLIFVPPKARAKDKNESARASVAAAGGGGGGAGRGCVSDGARGGPRGAYAAWTTAKHHNSRRVRRIARRDREALLPLLSAMLRRASKCPYGALLDLHCPTPPWLSRRGGSATDAPADAPRSLLASFTPPKAVAAFLWSTTSRIVPREMLGGPRSRAAIRAFLLRLGGPASVRTVYPARGDGGRSRAGIPVAPRETRRVDRRRRGESRAPRRARRRVRGAPRETPPVDQMARRRARRPAAPLAFLLHRDGVAPPARVLLPQGGVGATHRRAPRGDDGRPRGRDARESRRRGRPSRRGRSRGRHRRHRGVSAHAATTREAPAPAPPPRIRETATPAKGDGSASRRHARPPRGGVLPNPPRLERRKRAGGRRRTMEGEDRRSGTTRRALVSSGEHQPSSGCSTSSGTRRARSRA